MLSSAKHKAEEAEIAALLKKKGNLNPAEKSTGSGVVNTIKLPLEKSPLERDNGYVMTFIIQQIEWMRDQIEATGFTKEIRLVFPSAEKLSKTWEEQHPAELCTILQDYIRFFVRMNERFLIAKQEELSQINQQDEKQLILHSVELEKL